MSRVLITGFKPFDGETINPSEALALEIAKEKNWEVLILPVSYQRAFVTAQAGIEKADIVIHLGQAGGRSQIQVERFALNWIEATISDADGESSIPRRITVEDADILPTSWDMNIDAINKAKMGVSLSAGGYVCNNLYFKTLLSYPKKKVVFIHVPFCEEQVVGKDIKASISLDEMKLTLLQYFSSLGL